MVPRFEFGGIVLDAERRTIRRGRQSLHLTPKEFDILLYLVINGGRAVAKRELLEQLWPGVVVEESNLTQNIFLLRKALGGTADGHPIIETIPKHGYRLAVPVKIGSANRVNRRAAGWFVALLLWSLLCYWLGYSRSS
ncbi:MAG: transcriptional regulator [Bryobacterales bacterium]|nr:transcriptional regulator [Bryobacterales bacterium]